MREVIANQRVQDIENAIHALGGRIGAAESQLGAAQREIGTIEGRQAEFTAPLYLRVTAWATVAAVVVGVAMPVLSLYLNHREALQTRESVQGQVTRLQGDLRMVTAVVAPQLLQQIGPVITAALSAPKAKIPSILQEPIRTLTFLRKQEAKAPASEITATSAAMSELVVKEPDVSQVWQTAAELVSYRSESPHYGQIQIPQLNIPLCITGGGLIEGGTISGTYKCAVDLDSLRFKDMTFVRTVIIYQGGPLNLQNVHFVACVFLFNVDAVPHPKGQDYMMNLLKADNIESVGISTDRGI